MESNRVIHFFVGTNAIARIHEEKKRIAKKSRADLNDASMAIHLEAERNAGKMVRTEDNEWLEEYHQTPWARRPLDLTSTEARQCMGLLKAARKALGEELAQLDEKEIKRHAVYRAHTRLCREINKFVEALEKSNLYLVVDKLADKFIEETTRQ